MDVGTRKDYLLAVIAGLMAVLFALPSLINAEVTAVYFLMALFVVVPVLWVIGIFLGKFLSRWFSVTFQFAKFVVVGFLNTSIDFGVLNLLSMLSGVTAGFLIGGVNVPGFALASINSYFWNKLWVFKAGEKEYSDFFSFVAVLLVGVAINGSIVILITTYINPMFGLSAGRWLNIAKAAATAVALFWNFIGFKFLVFKK
jgi:putative flippase GtrA